MTGREACVSMSSEQGPHAKQAWRGEGPDEHRKVSFQSRCDKATQLKFKIQTGTFTSLVLMHDSKGSNHFSKEPS